MKKLRDFNQFKTNEEIDNPLDQDYLSDIERRAREDQEEKMQAGEISRNPMREIMPLVNELQNIQMQGDNIEKLEKLAHVVVNAYYGSILDEVEMDAKIVRPGDGKLAEMAEEMEEEEKPTMTVPETIMDMPFDIDDVYKRKLINNIIQGAAKNTHRIIHTPECKDGLNEINPRLFPLIDKLIKSNEVIEWEIPKEAGVDMMKGNPNGAVQVVWKEKPVIDEDDDDEDEEEEIRAQIFVRAIDFVVLLHEMLKGIYEAVLGEGLPDQEEVLAETDTLGDEFEDLKYGPYIKQDLDAFILVNNKVSEVPNGLEHFYGYFVQLDATEFIQLFKDMIAGTDQARKKVDKMIDEVIDPIIEWYKEDDMRQAGLSGDEGELELTGDDGYPAEGEEGEREGDEWKQLLEPDAGEPKPNDYSTMSQPDLKRAMDKALDSNDFESAKEIGKYLN